MDNYTDVLEKECPDFANTKKAFEVMQYYSELKDVGMNDVYTNGHPRKKFSQNHYVNSIMQRLYNHWYSIRK